MNLTIQRLLLLSFLIISILSCQKDKESSPNGLATFEVFIEEVNVVNIGRIQSVSTDDFTISIINKSNEEEVASYPRFADMPASVLLRQGEYKVTASNGTETSADFDNPVYYGESDLSITAGETSNASIECILSNIKVQITHTEDAKTRFPDVYTEVTTGNGTLEYSQVESRHGYFALNGEPTTLTVNIHYTQDGTARTTTKTYDANANDFFDITINASLDGEGGIDVGIGDENVIEDEIVIGEDLSEREILMDIYYSLKGDENWNTGHNWGSALPIDQWEYIKTNAEGNVQSIEIRDDICFGYLPASIGGLKSMTKLYIVGVGLKGSIPKEIGLLSNLDSLILYSNHLEGEIPIEICKLTKLKVLALAYNSNLTGSIPEDIGNLTNLTYFGISDCEITGDLPQSFYNLNKLQSLWINNTKVSGQISPNISNFKNLEWLNISDNQFYGAIPSTFSELTNIETLSCIGNSFSNTFPKDFLENNYLDHSRSDISEKYLPDFDNDIEIDNEKSTLLEWKNQDEEFNPNDHLNWDENIPYKEWTGIDLGFDGQIRKLRINYFLGDIDSEIFNFDKLYYVNFNGSYIQGIMPSNITNLDKLIYLGLENTELTGKLTQGVLDLVEFNGGTISYDPENAPQ